MHRRLALALSELDGVAPGEVAAHWQGAGDHRNELPWRIRAAREAEARFGGEQAALHWVRALELWPTGQSEAESLSASRAEAYFGAMDGWDLAGMSLRGLELAKRAKEECTAWSKADRAEVLRKLAAYKTSEGDVEGDYLTAEAIRLYLECPQTPAIADRLAVAFIHQSFTLSFRGRTAAAAASLQEAQALLVAHHPNSSRLREVQAGLAWMDAVQGRLDRALRDLAELPARSPAEPAPVRDVMVAMYHSDVLLMAGKGADEVGAAAESGLAAARERGLDTHESNMVLANVVIALIRAGHIAQAGVSSTSSQTRTRCWIGGFCTCNESSSTSPGADSTRLATNPNVCVPWNQSAPRSWPRTWPVWKPGPASPIVRWSSSPARSLTRNTSRCPETSAQMLRARRARRRGPGRSKRQRPDDADHPSHKPAFHRPPRPVRPRSHARGPARGPAVGRGTSAADRIRVDRALAPRRRLVGPTHEAPRRCLLPLARCAGRPSRRAGDARRPSAEAGRRRCSRTRASLRRNRSDQTRSARRS